MRQVTLPGNPASAFQPRPSLLVPTKLSEIRLYFTYAQAKKVGVKLIEHRTYDAEAKAWTRLTFHNGDGYEVQTAPPSTDGELLWQTSTDGNAKRRFREHEHADGKSIALLGETSTDGKTWNALYHLSCKK